MASGCGATPCAVYLDNGATLACDELVVASGASLLFDETDGLWRTRLGENVFSFWSAADPLASREAPDSFERGKLVVNTIDMPIKRPVAPPEFCSLDDWFPRKRGVAFASSASRLVDLSEETPRFRPERTPAADRQSARNHPMRQCGRDVAWLRVPAKRKPNEHVYLRCQAVSSRFGTGVRSS